MKTLLCLLLFALLVAAVAVLVPRGDTEDPGGQVQLAAPAQDFSDPSRTGGVDYRGMRTPDPKPLDPGPTAIGEPYTPPMRPGD